METLSHYVEYAALLCLGLVIAGVIFFFLVEWFATSPSQGPEARILELPVQETFERNDRAA